MHDKLPHTPQTIATFTRHQIGTVERVLKVFMEFGLVEILTDVIEMFFSLKPQAHDYHDQSEAGGNKEPA